MMRHEMRQATILVTVVAGIALGCLARDHWFGLLVMLCTGFNFGVLVFGQIHKQLRDSHDRLRTSHERIYRAYQRMCLTNRGLVEIQGGAPANEDKTVVH